MDSLVMAMLIDAIRMRFVGESVRGVWSGSANELFISFRPGGDDGIRFSFADPAAMHTGGFGRREPRTADAGVARLGKVLAGAELAAIMHEAGERVFVMELTAAERGSERIHLSISLVPGRAGFLTDTQEGAIGKESLRALFESRRESGLTQMLRAIADGSLPAPGAAALPARLREEIASAPADRLARLRASIDGYLRGETKPALHRLHSEAPDFLRKPYLAPFIYESLGEARVFADVEHAATAFFTTARAVAQEARLFRNLKQILKGEAERVERSEEAVERDRRQIDDSTKYQRFGEALLLAQPEARGERVESRWFDEEGEHPIDVPLIEGMGARESAARYFDLAKKGRRAAEHLAARGSAIAKRKIAVNRLAAELQAVSSAEELDALNGRVSAFLGRAAPPRSARRQDSRRQERRRFIEVPCEEGEILIGRSAAENIELTFSAAAPNDIWLHAHDVPGSHVVLRLRPGLREPSRPALLRAASLAAWFSKARNDGAVEVVYTERKFVRRMKGGMLGQVRLERFKTLRVAPAGTGVTDVDRSRE